MHYFDCRYPWTVYASADKRKIAKIARRLDSNGRRGYEPRQTFINAERFKDMFGACVLVDLDWGGVWKVEGKEWRFLHPA